MIIGDDTGVDSLPRISVSVNGNEFKIDFAMKPLREIRAFPAPHRKVLEEQFGVSSAEAFFEHATRNAKGIQTALKITQARLDVLLQAVEGYLAPAFVKSCRKPVVKHSRGVIVD